ncbi:Genetic interactor of prohibitins 3, mitochondrial [Colletotrichum tanaceti]|nr:Genetic interactor of prohibitins 3, mitochondrial [Colletotrichum tanaceti]
MHRALSSRWLRSALSIGDRATLAEVPVYLCPSLGAASGRHSFAPASEARRGLPYGQRRCVHVEVDAISEAQQQPPPPATEPTQQLSTKKLPLQCSGCGALTQTTDAGQAGYYDLSRRAVKEFLASANGEDAEKELKEEDKVVEEALENLSEEQLAQLGLDPKTLRYGEELETDRSMSRPATQRAPLCDRCHKLVHHHSGKPIYHPTVDSLRETIEESPFKTNHIYHIIDAADFPMSFMPRLHQILDANLKHRNRRNRAGRYFKDRKFDMSFIITRSDLLAPKKEQVDALMPYLREVLRNSLGKFGRLVTLGNLKCVSAQRGWWTRTLKEQIYERGGAGWMVGKVNVGKSQLFESVFPKGTTANIPSKHNVEVSMFAREEDADGTTYSAGDVFESEADRLDLDALLPPARNETNFPEMPTVSSLPGTTASPIRIPFGNGKGELIDLPGVARSDLENYVKPEHRPDLVMHHRIKPEQRSLKPGQSLLLGGLIRITPTTPDLVFLTYNFTPIPEHATATEKAVEFQEQKRESYRVQNLAVPGIVDKIKLAGTFQLRYDVTKERAGPLTRRHVGNMKVENLPWRVLAIDLLIEGCGWVEIVAQARTRTLFAGCAPFTGRETAPEPEPEPEPIDPFSKMEKAANSQSVAKVEEKKKPAAKPDEPHWPEIEVWSPEGRFVGSRMPMNAWLINKSPKKAIKSRPRKSMKGAKKAAKAAKRAAGAAA